MKKDPQHSSTITFVEMFNDAFDILNIRGLSDGTRQRNTFKERLSSLDDWRFEVSLLSTSSCRVIVAAVVGW